jgi:predicted nucleic acid-binding protein
MLAAIDSDFLSLLLNPDTDPPIDPATGKPVNMLVQRMEYLVSELERQKIRVVVPTPALSELLVIAGESGPDYLTLLDGHSVLKVEPFDQKAAVEAAASTRQALAEGNKKSGSEKKWQCVKTDRQIVAVAKTLGATRIYSNDGDVRNIAAKVGIEVVHVWDLPVPQPTQPPLVELMLAEEAKAAISPTEIAQPSEQSPADEQPKAPAPLQALPSPLPDAQGPQQPGSSPTVPQPPLSEK